MSSIINVVVLLFLIACLIKSLSRVGHLTRDNQHQSKIIDMLSAELTNTSKHCDSLMKQNKTLQAENKLYRETEERLRKALENYEYYEL